MSDDDQPPSDGNDDGDTGPGEGVPVSFVQDSDTQLNEEITLIVTVESNG